MVFAALEVLQFGSVLRLTTDIYSDVSFFYACTAVWQLHLSVDAVNVSSVSVNI